jgi:DNA-binding Xre family transcriptional regulator
MFDFAIILQRLKFVLKQYTHKTKIKDKEVAEVLGLTPEYFAVIKKRNKIPYEAIIRFCIERQISLNWIFSGEAPIKTLPFDQVKKNGYNKIA